MASLVADYGTSSESEEESDSASAQVNVDTHQSNTEISKPGINLMTSSNLDDSDDSGEEEKDRTEKECVETEGAQKTDEDRLPNPLAFPAKLPSPQISLKKNKNQTQIQVENSVFVNKYMKAEAVKHSILEQHVKMTVDEQLKEGKHGKKKVCWNFKKGKCRFGHSCKYAHDNESLAGDRTEKTNEESGSDQQKTNQVTASHNSGAVRVYNDHSAGFVNSGFYGHHGNQVYVQPGDDEDEDERERKKRKRTGMATSLIPPKKAMQALNKQRLEERPWTM